MNKFKFSSVPSVDLYELTLKASKIFLNNVELLVPVTTIFLGHNLQGKFIKGYDLNGVLLFNVLLDIGIDEIEITPYESSSNILNIKW